MITRTQYRAWDQNRRLCRMGRDGAIYAWQRGLLREPAPIDWRVSDAIAEMMPYGVDALAARKPGSVAKACAARAAMRAAAAGGDDFCKFLLDGGSAAFDLASHGY